MAEEKLSASIKLMIGRGRGEKTTAFGRGSAALLHGVDTYGSLNKTAKELHMAYSKAWTLIKRVEESLGYELIERHGAHGSVLTEKGRAFLEAYEAFENDLTEFIDANFEKRFMGL